MRSWFMSKQSLFQRKGLRTDWKILIPGNVWEGENIEALLNTSIFSKMLNKHSSETQREKSWMISHCNVQGLGHLLQVEYIISTYWKLQKSLKFCRAYKVAEIYSVPRGCE